MASTGIFASFGPVWLPRFTELKDQAQKWIDDDKPEIAIILTQTAAELLLEHYLPVLMKDKGVPEGMQAWVQRGQRTYSLKTDRTRELFESLIDLSDPTVKTAYDKVLPGIKKLANKRNRIVHGGETATNQQARDGLAAFQKFGKLMALILP